MYRILGNDQKESEPISAEEVCARIVDRRVSAHSRLKTDGMAEWKALSEFPEFADVLAGRSEVPRFSVVETEAEDAAAEKVPTSRLAVASVALGAVGFLGITGLAGLILGLWGLFRISRSGGSLKGTLVAVWGMTLSGLMVLLFFPAATGLLLPGFVESRRQARESQCLDNAQQIVQAIRTYADGHQGQLPPVLTWGDSILDVGMIRSSQVFICPSKPLLISGYAYNKHLDGKLLTEVNPRTVLIFESNGGWNASGDYPVMALSRHGPRSVVGFVDGSVASLQGWQINQLRWVP